MEEFETNIEHNNKSSDSSNIINKIDKNKTPEHVAIIMDGNGRWAQSQGLPRKAGHQAGIKPIRAVIEVAVDMNIEYLTLYTFSTENWGRPPEEINALMNLLKKSIIEELPMLKKNKIRLNLIGDISAFPAEVQDKLYDAVKKTAELDKFVLSLALNYGSRGDILKGVKELVKQAENKKITSKRISDEFFASKLSTHMLPDPDLLIRTSGEKRLSNFLLWEAAYAELWFTNVYWPEFQKEDFYQALYNFQCRERRYGEI